MIRRALVTGVAPALVTFAPVLVLWPAPHPRPAAAASTGAQVTVTSPEVVAARRLARAPLRIVQIRSPALSPATARRFARRRQRAIPLPAGGNFNGIRWARAPQPLTPGEAEQTLEYNARCQWLRAAAEHRPASAARIARSAERWPALRALPSEPRPDLVAGCYASHHREVARALSLGLRPSR